MLRSRGELDRPRPVMESFSKMITGVTDGVTSAVEMVHNLHDPIITSIHGLIDSLSSLDYDDLRRRWGEYEDMDDFDDPDGSYEFSHDHCGFCTYEMQKFDTLVTDS